MATYELNEALARAGPKPGEVRNPLGISNPVRRVRNREIRDLLRTEANTQCVLPGYEHLTNIQAVVRVLMERALEGQRWAITILFNRLYGRVPLDIEMSVQPPDLTVLTEDQLRQRVELLREVLAPRPQLPEVAEPDPIPVVVNRVGE